MSDLRGFLSARQYLGAPTDRRQMRLGVSNHTNEPGAVHWDVPTDREE